MLLNHIDECRTAGSGHLLAFLVGLGPLLSLIGSRHVAAQPYFHHIREAQLLKGYLPAGHGDIRPELAFGGRSHHGNHTFSSLNQADYVHHEGLGANGAKGTAVDTGAALDAFLLVNHADAVFIICNGVHRADFLTGTLQMGNCIIWASLGTFAALLTFGRVNIGAFVAHADCPEITGILAGLSHTLAAVVGYYIGSNGTLLACSIDDLHHIGGVFACRTLALCQAHPLFDDFPFLIDTAAVSCLWPRYHGIWNLAALLFQISIPCSLSHLIENIMLQTQDSRIIGYHLFSSSL